MAGVTVKVNERRTVGGGVDWPLCVPQPWTEIDAHGQTNRLNSLRETYNT